MSRVTRKDWYERVNAAWGGNVPTLTQAEHVKIARRMYRFIMGATWTGAVQITSGNRYAWIRRGVLIVNPTQPINGRRGDVHLLSHKFDSLLNPDSAPHHSNHARIELSMVKEIVKRGYLTGALAPEAKPEKPAAAPKSVKYACTLRAIERWDAKYRRAANALKRLGRSLKAQERAMAKRSLGEGSHEADDPSEPGHPENPRSDYSNEREGS